MTTEVDEAPACYRHPKRETHVRCTRCEQYICPDCMRDAAVGLQCIGCVREGNKTVRQARTVFGGQVSVTAWATYVLIAINVVTYLGELVRPGIVGRFDNLGYGLMASGGTPYRPVGGAVPGFEQVGIAHGEWYRLITSAFLHQPPDGGSFGILHIAFNMWWLWRLGREAEEMLGRVRFLALYLLSAIGGSVLGYLVAPYDGAIGASGAIFGLAAAYYVFSRKLGNPMGEANRIIMLYLIWMVLSAGFTSWEGHLGGLLAGGVIAVGFAYAPAKHRTIVQACTAVAMLLLLVALVALKSMELTSGTPLAEPMLNGIAHIR